RHPRLVSDWSSDVCSSDLSFSASIRASRMSFTLWWKPPLLGTDLSCSPARPARVGTLLETRRHCFPDIILQLKSEASNLWPIGRRESTTVLISVTRTPSWCVHREDRAPDAPRSWYGSRPPFWLNATIPASGVTATGYVITEFRADGKV